MAELTEKGRRTRQRIVEATALRVLESGVDGTSLDDVRAATLTSKSQLFHYFPGGKAELVRAVAQWEGDQLLAAQEPHVHDLSTWESWAAWRRALEDYYIGLGRWACPIGSLTAQLAATDAETAALLRSAWAAWRTALADGVRRMQAAGLMGAAVDPDRTAASVLAALQGGLLLSQPERASWPLEAALDAAWAVLGAPSPAGALALDHVQVSMPRGGEQAARRFYAEGLGLAEVARPASLAGRGGCWFRATDGDGRTTAEVHLGVEDPFVPARRAHPALRLADAAALEATARRVADLGAEVSWEERDTLEGRVRFHCRDPFGNRVEVLAPTA